MECLRAILLGGAIAATAGCHGDGKPVVEIPPPAMIATGYIAFATVNKHPARPPAETPKEDQTSPGDSSNPGPSTKEEMLTGIKVPDQPGYIRSPFNTGAGMIDARGMPPGAEMYDPYSGKTILVP
jgi:hypothetical protein